MKALFGAGCFWHVEEEFRKLNGVRETTVGYSGGNMKKPKYEEIHEKETGHVEVCQIEYDEKIISYSELLKVFWKIHNPTQVNGQGPDIGLPYRSVIFYYDDKQRKIAEKSKQNEQKKYEVPIATTIEKAKTFYKAEDYHQKYLMKQGLKTCSI